MDKWTDCLACDGDGHDEIFTDDGDVLTGATCEVCGGRGGHVAAADTRALKAVARVLAHHFDLEAERARGAMDTVAADILEALADVQIGPQVPSP